MIEQSAEVVSNKRIAPETFLLKLRSIKVVKSAEPGQFVMIRVREGLEPLLRRPFSICGIQKDGHVVILYRVVGRGTSLMAEMKEGEKVSILGPLGKGFDLPRRDQGIILVAGGIGVAPLFFLAQTLKDGTIPFRFMAGFGSSNEIISLEQVGGPSLDLTIATDDGTEGYAGPVTDLLENYLCHNQNEGDALSLFTCGPAPMLKRVAMVAIDRGISCQASLETAMACGLGACQGCAVRASSDESQSYYHVCKDGPVFPVNAIDWNSL